jgi:hypothetical protein
MFDMKLEKKLKVVRRRCFIAIVEGEKSEGISFFSRDKGKSLKFYLWLF